MKKVILSSVMAVALLCSVSVMAQDAKDKKCCDKPKTEAKADAKKDCKKSECTKKCDKGEKKAACDEKKTK